ncbi:YceD family protein [Mesorhizobium sp. ORS 3428]|uniref:YceD family protein n=1 Tax=Mesorhizobium sp. ORS 3428 TaxID=540997 RepID=UPI0008D8FEE7|nr:YceD family protein [Mesorhizobium sp. ORS 3428]OHV87970.1 metal-binding protein [Mesorhizobium sp. ORS 3428]
MKHAEPKSPVSFVANVARLPQKGLPVVIEADERQRAALAAEHGLLSVESYRAELLVAPWKRNGVKVSGGVVADITQACIVTLDPVAAHIDEPVEALFLPEQSKLGREGFEGGGEIILDADGPDSPETFSGDTIDVGALAEQFFGLAIDPYPRKPGVSLGAAGDDEPEESEFQKKLRSLLGKS